MLGLAVRIVPPCVYTALSFHVESNSCDLVVWEGLDRSTKGNYANDLNDPERASAVNSMDVASIIYAITFGVVLLFAAFLLGLGGVSLLVPANARSFLLGFAKSPFTHYLEMLLRLMVGGSLILQAPYLSYPAAFGVFGWMMVVTTAFLILLPWKWHQRFAEKAVPRALNYLPLVGVVSLALGATLVLLLLKR